MDGTALAVAFFLGAAIGAILIGILSGAKIADLQATHYCAQCKKRVSAFCASCTEEAINSARPRRGERGRWVKRGA